MRSIEPNHPHPEKGQIRVYEEGENPPNIRSSKQGALKNMTYYELVEVLGEPTYPNRSGDEKTQKEWVIEYTPFGEMHYIFRIYDWKTNSAWNTMTSLTTWSIGGEEGSEFTAMQLESLLRNLISMNKV
jgi:hypothetical protein